MRSPRGTRRLHSGTGAADTAQLMVSPTPTLVDLTATSANYKSMRRRWAEGHKRVASATCNRDTGGLA